MGGEGLDAQVHAVDAHRGHGRNPLAVAAAGIEFDRQFGMMRLEAEQQLMEQADEIDQRQAVRTAAAKGDADRKSVGSGNSVSVPVDLGRRRLIKKKNKKLRDKEAT